MRIITIANQKGGCAKTTTVVNLAAALAELGHKVLVIDLDPQANASQWLGAETIPEGAFRLLTEDDDPDTLWSASKTDNIDIIAASQSLANTEKALAGKMAIDSILRRRLVKLDQNRWDFVLLDTPPTLGIITLNALVACRELLIPVTTHVLTLAGVAQMMKLVRDAKEVLNPELEILGFVATRVNIRTRHSKDVLNALTERFGSKVFKSLIRENVRLAEAPSFRQSILAYDSKSSASQDYRDLAREVVKLQGVS